VFCFVLPAHVCLIVLYVYAMALDAWTKDYDDDDDDNDILWHKRSNARVSGLSAWTPGAASKNAISPRCRRLPIKNIGGEANISKLWCRGQFLPTQKVYIIAELYGGPAHCLRELSKLNAKVCTFWWLRWAEDRHFGDRYFGTYNIVVRRPTDDQL